MISRTVASVTALAAALGLGQAAFAADSKKTATASKTTAASTAKAKTAAKPTAAAKIDESGVFEVRGDWDSFSVWTLTFKAGKLVDSFTDDLDSEDWPTTLRKKGAQRVLTQVTEGGDATLTEELVVEWAAGAKGKAKLVVKRARSTFVDHTDDDATSVQTRTVTVKRTR